MIEYISFENKTMTILNDVECIMLNMRSGEKIKYFSNIKQ